MFVFSAICSSGARVRFIEGKTGGGASPTGTVQSYNSDRSSSNISKILDVAGANAGKASYDATLFTGGASLVDEFIGANGVSGTLQKWILAPNTLYQVSIYETDAVPGTIKMSWDEIIERLV